MIIHRRARIIPLVREHIAPGTKVRTEGSPIYAPLMDEPRNGS